MVKTTINMLTKEVSSPELVTFAVYLLGGDAKPVDTEDVAIKAHELARNRFAWKKYPDQINLELVRVTLSDAKKEKYGALLAGSGRSGWTLTKLGSDWIRRNLKHLENSELDWQKGRSKAGSIDAVRKSREEKRLKSTDAWVTWNDDGQTSTQQQAEAVFRIDGYADQKMVELKITRLTGMFEDNKALTDFLLAMADQLKK